MILAVFWTTFVILRCFWPKIKKYPKMTVRKNIKKKDFTTSFKYRIFHSYSMNLLILLICFVSCNVLGHFFTVLVTFTFSKIVKNAFLKTPNCFQRFNIWTKQNFLSNKKSQSTPFRYGLGAKKPILKKNFTWTPHLGTKLCPYELIFHEQIEENSPNHLCFIKKKISSGWFREIFKLRFLTLH